VIPRDLLDLESATVLDAMPSRGGLGTLRLAQRVSRRPRRPPAWAGSQRPASLSAAMTAGGSAAADSQHRAVPLTTAPATCKARSRHVLPVIPVLRWPGRRWQGYWRYCISLSALATGSLAKYPAPKPMHISTYQNCSAAVIWTMPKSCSAFLAGTLAK